MQYGHFDTKNREYIITNPHTPVKWTNYIGTLAFGGIVDHTGGALICKEDPALNRITKYIPQLPDADFKGTTLYLRLHTENGYQVFSPYYVPTLDAYDRYQCHIGMGYTRIVSEFYGIRTDVTIFVPAGANCVIRDINITNLNSHPVILDAIPIVEYTHFDALKQYTNADWVPQTMQSRATQIEDGLTTLVQAAFMKINVAENYFTSNLPVSSFETDRAIFLGRYGNWANPKALQQPELNNSEALRGDNIAALMHHLGEVQPGETKRLITQLGQAESVDLLHNTLTYYRKPKQVENEFAKLNAFWGKYLATIQVDTPSQSMNHMLNAHHPHQCHTTKNWSRYLSLYQLGLGARGLGFRDSSQDVMGVISHIPNEARELIEKLLSVQRVDGSAYHQFYPLSMEASIGDAAERIDRPDYYGDDHLWSLLAVCAYVKETGDTAFLDKMIPFYDKALDGLPIDTATVREHLHRAIEFTRKNTGSHGLPLLGFADWNDPTNLPTGAESIFNANLYGRGLSELIDVMEYVDDEEAAKTYQTYYDDMKQVVNREAWDGDWYLRYYDEQGQPLGSKSNTTGQIYSNAQSWTVFSGFATQPRAISALDAVHEQLNTSKGIKLSGPGFNGYDEAVGGVSTYPPGAKENGGIFLHANPWVMIAETLVGRGDRAFQYYDQINPAAKNDLIDEFECEPYVYPQNILGDEHPQFGLARNSWLSGTASWVYQAATQYILGVSPTLNGLKVDPCIPADWDGFAVKRQFRGATYTITVSNPDHVSKGVKAVTVDGESIDGQIIPIFEDGEHSVDVVMG
jgi:cellobiose phosphorylase